MSRERIIQIALISAAVVFFVVVLIFTIDYAVFRDNRIKNRLANHFCECAMQEDLLSGDYNVQEDFQYPAALDSIYATKFRRYKKGMTDREKENFIEDVRNRVFEKCPSAVEQIFR
jgi:hypothetical protein